MSTLTLGDFLVTLLSIVPTAVAILNAVYGSEFIRTLGRKGMILQSLMNANRDFVKFYNDMVSSPSPFYTIILIILIILPFLMAILAVISTFFVNLADGYKFMIIITFLAFILISIVSFVLYFNTKGYKISSTAEIFEKKLVKFKKVCRILAVLWVIVVSSYIIPALNVEGYYGFSLNYEIQNFIWIYIPLLFAFITIFFFINAGFLSTNLTWDLINKKLAEKSLLPEIDAYVRGLDGKLESIHGFVVNLGRYVKLETAKTVETLKYADIQRISSPKEISDLKCK